MLWVISNDSAHQAFGAESLVVDADMCQLQMSAASLAFWLINQQKLWSIFMIMQLNIRLTS